MKTIFEFKMITSSFSMKRFVVGLMAFMSVSTAHAASPLLSGLYKVGQAGLVDFSSQDGQVIGKVKAGVSCEFPADVQIVTGHFEGTVFVGTVLICQEGPSCGKEKSYPFLGVWHDDMVVGNVKLDTGCRSAALDGRRLILRPATQEERAKVYTPGTATAVAQKGAKHPDKLEMLTEGSEKLQSGDYRAARDIFQRLIAYDEANFVARLGLGVSQVNLKEYSGAIESLDRAIKISKQTEVSPEVVAQAHFNMACALAQSEKPVEAMMSLKLAIENGTPGMFTDLLEHDEALAPLRDDVEFKKLMAAVRAKEKKRGRK